MPTAEVAVAAYSIKSLVPRDGTARYSEEFWSYSVLFAKIVDGRFDLWLGDCGPPGQVFSRFFATIEDGVDSRVKKWQSARQSKLFGRDISDPTFTLGQCPP